MIDLHIIVSDDTAAHWVEQAIASAMVACEAASVPVSLHMIQGIPGHIGRARANGYARGHQPFATFLDDDDWLEPGAFDGLSDVLASLPPAVLCREWLWQNGSQKQGGAGHHLTIVRRDQIVDHAAWRCCGDVVQNMRALKDEGAVRLDGYRYNHRLYESSKARVMRRKSREELEAAHVA